jgi:hypothetical protein
MTPVYGTIWILVIAFVASYIPFAYRMIDTSIIQIDRSLEEASSVCGRVALANGVASDVQTDPPRSPLGLDPRLHLLSPGNQRGDPFGIPDQ